MLDRRYTDWIDKRVDLAIAAYTMFATLKNKIREEIGSDVSTVVKNAGSIRGINSRHVSQVNIMSLDIISAHLIINLLVCYLDGF